MSASHQPQGLISLGISSMSASHHSPRLINVRNAHFIAHGLSETNQFLTKPINFSQKDGPTTNKIT
jgi:hypothetical protein